MKGVQALLLETMIAAVAAAALGAHVRDLLLA